MAVKITELTSLLMREEGWIGASRRQIGALAREIGFGEEAVSQIALVTTEMATNLTQHKTLAPMIRFGRTTEGERRGLLIIAEDSGPGIPDLGRAMADRFSTRGTLGGGLGAIQRLSGEFDLYSELPRAGGKQGTIVYSRHWAAPLEIKEERPPSGGPAPHLECEILTEAKSGENENGDGASVLLKGEVARVAVIDGLGHGLGARKATEVAQGILKSSGTAPLSILIDRLHTALRATYGAVIGVLDLNREKERATYLGIGNVDCRIFGKHPSRPVSSNGSLGVTLPRLREESFPFGPEEFFVMTSDGISTKWSPESYGGYLRASLLTRGALLLRDYGRSQDDATVAVGKWRN